MKMLRPREQVSQYEDNAGKPAEVKPGIQEPPHLCCRRRNLGDQPLASPPSTPAAPTTSADEFAAVSETNDGAAQEARPLAGKRALVTGGAKRIGRRLRWRWPRLAPMSLSPIAIRSRRRGRRSPDLQALRRASAGRALRLRDGVERVRRP